MTLTSFFRIFLAGVIAASVSGCSYMAKAILAPQKDISKFYLLTPTADTATPTTATAPTQSTSDSFTLGLGPIKLPPYLDRPEIVTRAAPNRLELSKEDRWGESLQNGFTRAMERDLSAQTGASIIVFPWYNTVHIDMQVQIDVYRFETDSPRHRDAVSEMDDPRLNGKKYFVHSRDPSDATLQTRRQYGSRRSPKPHNRRPEQPDRKHDATTALASGRAPSLTPRSL